MPYIQLLGFSKKHIQTIHIVFFEQMNPVLMKHRDIPLNSQGNIKSLSLGQCAPCKLNITILMTIC